MPSEGTASPYRLGVKPGVQSAIWIFIRKLFFFLGVCSLNSTFPVWADHVNYSRTRPFRQYSGQIPWLSQWWDTASAAQVNMPAWYATGSFWYSNPCCIVCPYLVCHGPLWICLGVGSHEPSPIHKVPPYLTGSESCSTQLCACDTLFAWCWGRGHRPIIAAVEPWFCPFERSPVFGELSIRWGGLRVERVGWGQRGVEEYCGRGRAEDWYHWTSSLTKRREGEEE